VGGWTVRIASGWLLSRWTCGHAMMGAALRPALDPGQRRGTFRVLGKSSPSHLFRGAFALSATRFPGRGAPRHPCGAPNCADRVMREAYSHELASAGFRPGAGLGEAAFHACAWAEPAGYAGCSIAFGLFSISRAAAAVPRARPARRPPAPA